jgi:hypothetical protein
MLSAVAGILDTYGGLRVVVTPRWRMKYHKRHDELLFVVPDFKVQEPVPWEKIPALIATVERHIDWWIKTRNDPDDLNQEPIKLYRLRCMEHPHGKRALNLEHIVT